MASSATAVTPLDRPSGHFITGSFVIDPANLAAATREVCTVTIPGAKVGDVVHVRPRAQLTAGMIVEQAIVSAADTVVFGIYNTTGGAINEASQTWDFELVRGSTNALRSF